MAEAYPHKFTSVNGEVARPDSLWLAIINRYSQQQLSDAAGKMVTNGIEWPEVPKFVEYLTGGRTPEQRARDAQINNAEPLPALEDLTDRSSTGRKWKAFMIIHGLLSRSSTMTMEQAQSMRDANPSEFKLMLTAHERETSKLRNRMRR